MNIALITAAGIGKRMQTEMNKIFMLLDEEPIITRTLRIFSSISAIDGIIIIAREEDKGEIERIASNFEKVSKVVLGGEKRQNSVYNGLISIENAKPMILL